MFMKIAKAYEALTDPQVRSPSLQSVPSMPCISCHRVVGCLYMVAAAAASDGRTANGETQIRPTWSHVSPSFLFEHGTATSTHGLLRQQYRHDEKLGESYKPSALLLQVHGRKLEGQTIVANSKLVAHPARDLAHSRDGQHCCCCCIHESCGVPFPSPVVAVILPFCAVAEKSRWTTG